MDTLIHTVTRAEIIIWLLYTVTAWILFLRAIVEGVIKRDYLAIVVVVLFGAVMILYVIDFMLPGGFITR